jgi:Tfp pilus assembly protein FimT
MARNRRTSRAASLLDLLIASSVFATLIATGLPRLARLRVPYAVMGASRQIAAMIGSARQQAIARNTSYRVRFDTGARTYTVERQSGGGWVQDQAPQKLATGLTFGDIPANPVINANGTLAAAVAIPVIGTAAHTRTVSVNVLGQTSIN